MSTRVMRYILPGAALLVALLLPHLIYPVLALDIIIWALFAVAFDLLLGYGGLLSFGHAAFFGGAAYAAGLAAKHLGLPFPLPAFAGMLAALVLALPIGYLSIRRTGIYFAMVTLAFAQLVYYIANQWRGVTGGENGLQGIPRSFPGVDLGEASLFYYFVLPIVVLGIWLAYRAVHSPFGHVVLAIRDNEARAKALGYPTIRYKLLLFLLSSGLSGLAGGLFAQAHGFAALEAVHWGTSGTVVMMTILGGMGTLWGGVIGAGLVLLLQDSLSEWTDAWGVITGAIFMIIVLSFRRGIWGTLFQQRRRKRPPEKPIPPVPQAGASGQHAAEGTLAGDKE